MYNPDEIEDRQVSIFHQLEQTCLELADLSYKIQISAVCNVGELPNGMKPVYKNFVYSRMLWSKSCVCVCVCSNGATAIISCKVLTSLL